MGESRYINGGRAYFQVSLFGYQTSSFTTKGFFDQLGYEEPMMPSVEQRKREILIWAAFVLGGSFTVRVFY